MELNSGIVFLSESKKSANIQINSGSIHYSKMDFEHLDFPFRKQAFIPKKDWRGLTTEEKNSLISTNYEYLDFLYIGKLPEDLINLIKKFDIHFQKERSLVFDRFRENPVILELFNDKINNFVGNMCIEKNNLEFHRLSAIPSGRYVTSINLNLEEFEYIGLHIDHSTNFKIESAHLSRNRICINIGNEDRYLYLINLSLLQIKNMLEKVLDINLVNVENITDYFFQFFPNYPVLRIKQKPYEYYIAPTDNCIHDGSTFQNKYLDITINFLGNFKPSIIDLKRT